MEERKNNEYEKTQNVENLPNFNFEKEQLNVDFKENLWIPVIEVQNDLSEILKARNFKQRPIINWEDHFIPLEIKKELKFTDEENMEEKPHVNFEVDFIPLELGDESFENSEEQKIEKPLHINFGEDFIPLEMEGESSEISEEGSPIVNQNKSISGKRELINQNPNKPKRKMTKAEKKLRKKMKQKILGIPNIKLTKKLLRKINKDKNKQGFGNKKNQKRKTVLHNNMNNTVQDYLLKIYQWNPLWIEEQVKKRLTDPPIVNYDELLPLLTEYTSYNDYCKIINPVVLLEIWHNLIYEYVNGDSSNKQPVVCSVVTKSVNLKTRPKQEKYRFQIEILVNRNDFYSENFPSKGELIHFSSMCSDKLFDKFAYIICANKSVLKPKIMYNKELEKFVAAPYGLVKFTLDTAKFNPNLEGGEIGMMKPIIYLHSILKQVLALKVLPLSPLMPIILKPNLDDFFIPNLPITDDDENLFAGDALNAKQLEAVKKAKLIFQENEPKICLIQGPPGTGKSKVIVNILMEYFSENMKLPNKSKIMVCAPSNVAVDEIVLRLLQIQQELPDEKKFRLVRIGRSEAVHTDVKPILAINLAKSKQPSTSKAGNAKKLGDNSERRVLREADIIASTLNSCFTKVMESVFGNDDLPVCIVDEATQCSETESLIPLMLGVKKLILVGDFNQLPATTFSQQVKVLGLDQSLFSRIHSAFKGSLMNPVITLNTQYRMVDAIVKWPNFYFYDNILRSSVPENYNFILRPYLMLNLDGTEDERRFINVNEANFVINLVDAIISLLSNTNRPINIGIITPYTDQKKLISQYLSFRPNYWANQKNFLVDVNTIDGFQGQERDIIIMSCVRSYGIGFMNDRQRLCVALTRAKHCFYLCGNFSTFRRKSMWKSLIQDAESRKLFFGLKSNISNSQIQSYIIRYRH